MHTWSIIQSCDYSALELFLPGGSSSSTVYPFFQATLETYYYTRAPRVNAAHAPFMPRTNIQLPPSSSVSWGKCLGFLSRKRTDGRTKGAENGLLWRRKSLPGTPNPSVNLRQPAKTPIQAGAAFACMGATQLSPGYCCSSYHESPANRTCALATNTAFLRARRLSTSASSASPLIEVSHSSMSA